MELQILTMRKLTTVIIVLASIIGFASCEKVLDVDLPDGVNGIVFEGNIENGQFPYVLITRSSNYFDPIETAQSAILNSIVEADSVFIEYDGTGWNCQKFVFRICLKKNKKCPSCLDLSRSQRALIYALT